ncbi:MSP domain protein [Cordyceps fumosorosea ARSEF 2679]|uniref:MSP domain protein n=1 Tax=Cordyceps fumosorosea (strain ARSEF 2679) TaxID=1081104 RepID=A0A162IGK3_CORFA|nr:MSP domain protein [Cordyceps fumosorosea ARSEF 2679]OAA56855.1 MSP domain protein [Cordyceps fumosorosea ARSEF 2679]
MSIDVEPLELNFRRPFTVEVSQTLTIRNTSAAPLAFKVKTTAPRQYCVRPNAGRIEPGQSFDVSVLLQAMKADPTPDTKCRDKFLVQSAPITGDKEFTSIAEVLDNTDKGLKEERKIRVNWLPAHGEADPSTALMTPSKKLVNGNTDTPDISHNFSSPSAGAPPPYNDDADAPEIDEKAPIETPAALASRAIPAVKDAGSETLEALKAKLAAAQAEIAGFKDSGLRQRNVKVGESESKAPSELSQAVKQNADGVSVQVVAILCLLSFLLAYFFF